MNKSLPRRFTKARLRCDRLIRRLAPERRDFCRVNQVFAGDLPSNVASDFPANIARQSHKYLSKGSRSGT
jgi:hypothetical protein